MTELIVAGSFVLVPLFLIVPLLGKYIDIRHASLQAARYEAWEYTVWYADRDDKAAGFHRRQPVKKLKDTKNESHRRFLSDPGIELANRDQRGWRFSDRNRLWADHNGVPLYGLLDERKAIRRSKLRGPRQAPDPLKIGKIILAVPQLAANFMSKILSVAKVKADFDVINTKGYFKSKVRVPTTNVDGLEPFDKINLIFSSQAGVLGDSWNTGGKDHTEYQVGGIVPTKLLDNRPIDAILSVVGVFAPELKPCTRRKQGSLWFGHVDIDAVHPDRLESGGRHRCDRRSGLCDFDPLPPQTECKP